MLLTGADFCQLFSVEHPRLCCALPMSPSRSHPLNSEVRIIFRPSLQVEKLRLSEDSDLVQALQGQCESGRLPQSPSAVCLVFGNVPLNLPHKTIARLHKLISIKTGLL